MIGCPVCKETLAISPARSRKSKTPRNFIVLTCPKSGKHFRGFIGDEAFVRKTMARAGMTSDSNEPSGE